VASVHYIEPKRSETKLQNIAKTSFSELFHNKNPDPVQQDTIRPSCLSARVGIPFLKTKKWTFNNI
jgi:hypothetical protein